MLIVRDVKVVWFCSLLFEGIELSLREHLPNFYECWWDHVFLDILLCNGLGIYLGLIFCRVFKLRRYSWDSLSEQKETYFGDANESSLSLSKLFSSARNFYPLVWYIIFINMVDLSNFILKFELWIPPDHIIL